MGTVSEALAFALKDHQAGRLQQAEQIYRQILLADGDCAEAWHLLGVIACQKGNRELAAQYAERAVQLKPDLAEAHNNLGIVYRELGRIDKALAATRRALELTPNNPEAHGNLGNILQDQGRLNEAGDCYRRALELKPDSAEVHSNLGNVRQRQGRLDDAMSHYRQAIVLSPNYADAHTNLGNTFRELGKLDDAMSHYGQAIVLNPNHAEAYTNRGNTLNELGKLDDAAACYQRALAIKPDDPQARFNQSLLLLLRGDFARGWPEYEWRFKCKDGVKSHLKMPPWDGSRLPDGTILLHAEQGFGDTLQFIRYAPRVKKRAGTVLLRCPPRLIPLLRRSPGIDRLIPADSELPPFDAESSLLSLPCAFQTILATIPREVPYLFADPELVVRWRSELPRGGFNIGIAWQGNPVFKHDKSRSIPLAHFGRLAALEGVRLISLQKEHGIDQIQATKDLLPLLELPQDLDESAGAFMDTAAVMMNLDLVITPDTAIAHLAGGLGIPVWLALPLIPDWRWLLDRDDSPWYPTMRLFRQTSRGNWGSVFESIHAELSELLHRR